MKASNLRVTQRRETSNNRGLGVQSYGANNDYPQRVRNIVAGSGTGSLCVRTLTEFLLGKGLAINGKVVNGKGQTVEYILQQVCADFALHNGFCLHINYNELLYATELHHIPFEHVRFKALDSAFEFNQVAVHDDWAMEFTALKRFNKNDIAFIDLFDPDPNSVPEGVQRAGGWEAYRGQVLYVSAAGDKTYPLAAFDAELTDMNTEEGVSNVLNRNTRNGFRPAAMVVDKLNVSESDRQESELKNALQTLQTDENTSKLVYVSVDNDEEIPQVVPFETVNYDKELTFTAEHIESKIGAVFCQPPILRAQDVGSNFGADALRDAYNFYNSVCHSSRALIAKAVNGALALFQNPPAAGEIEPLSYSYGSTNVEDIPVELLAVMTTDEKRGLLGLPPLQQGQTL